MTYSTEAAEVGVCSADDQGNKKFLLLRCRSGMVEERVTFLR
jgi:hypothetical protein